MFLYARSVTETIERDLNYFIYFEQRVYHFSVTVIGETILPACDVIDVLHLHVKQKCLKNEEIRKRCTMTYFNWFFLSGQS